MTDEEIVQMLGTSRLKLLETNIQKAYSFGGLFISDNPILQVPSALCMHQNIMNLSVDYNLERACNDKVLDAKCIYAPNTKKNCKHVELSVDGFIFTHSSVQSFGCLPREAVFRKSLSYSNQLSFFRAYDSSPKYGILLHHVGSVINEQNDAKIYLGIPDADYMSWAHLIPLDKIIASITPANPETTRKEYNDFKFYMRGKTQQEVDD